MTVSLVQTKIRDIEIWAAAVSILGNPLIQPVWHRWYRPIEILGSRYHEVLLMQM